MFPLTRRKKVFGSFLPYPMNDSLTAEEMKVRDQFHSLYYDLWHNKRISTIDSSWLGHRNLKCPLDLWVYQEIMFENRPDFIVETGTHEGGSAMFMASICDMLGTGKVITVELAARKDWPKHPRINYLVGSSTDAGIFEQVKRLVGKGTVMVVLDSDHKKEHVLEEIRLYSQLVTPRQYLIVEDTNINGHPVYSDFGPGPHEAVQEFLLTSDNFEVDANRERFILTMNPGGYLRRKAVE